MMDDRSDMEDATMGQSGPAVEEVVFPGSAAWAPGAQKIDPWVKGWELLNDRVTEDRDKVAARNAEVDQALTALHHDVGVSMWVSMGICIILAGIVVVTQHELNGLKKVKGAPQIP